MRKEKEMIKAFNNKYADYKESKDKRGYINAFSNRILSENVFMGNSTNNHNVNTLILGPAGSGKSRFFLEPNLLQMNSSFVITDPHGVLLDKYGETFRRFGYNIKVFNIASFENSNTYNPFKYFEKESDIEKIVETFIENTNRSNNKTGYSDPFWDDAMKAFLCACIAFLSTKPEGYDKPYGQIKEITGGNIYKDCFSSVSEFIRMAYIKWTADCNIELYTSKRTGHITKLGDEKNNGANASKLAAMFENLRIWEADRQGCSPDEIVKPYALREWENFRISPLKTNTTILMTVAVKLDPFNIQGIKDLTSSDNICLDTFSEQKDALFLITPPENNTYNFLISFIYTQLLDILCEKYLKLKGRKYITLPDGDLIRLLNEEESKNSDNIIQRIKNSYSVKAPESEIKTGYEYRNTIVGNVKIKKDFFDGWYDILDSEGNLVTRRPSKKLADAVIDNLRDLKVNTVETERLIFPVHFIMDEFPNTGIIPGFLEKLSTMRHLGISASIVCQTITQLKDMYPDNYEVIIGNCGTILFFGGREIATNEYLSKKIEKSTIETNEITSVDLFKLPSKKAMIFINDYECFCIIIDDKFNIRKHKYYKFTPDYACDINIPNACVYKGSVKDDITDNNFFKPEKETIFLDNTVSPITRMINEISPVIKENNKDFIIICSDNEEIKKELIKATEKTGLKIFSVSR